MLDLETLKGKRFERPGRSLADLRPKCLSKAVGLQPSGMEGVWKELPIGGCHGVAPAL